MLGFADKGISLEALLDYIKMKLGVPLDIQYTKGFFSEQCAEGKFNLINENGLNRK
jgi:hypothetical protein